MKNFLALNQVLSLIAAGKSSDVITLGAHSGRESFGVIKRSGVRSELGSGSTLNDPQIFRDPERSGENEKPVRIMI